MIVVRVDKQIYVQKLDLYTSSKRNIYIQVLLQDIFVEVIDILKGEEVEKIEVRKGKEVYYYTGILEDLENGWVEIKTTRGETLSFRKEQIEGRQILKTIARKGNDGQNT